MTVDARIRTLFQAMLHSDDDNMDLFDWKYGDETQVITSRLNAGQVAALDTIAEWMKTSRSALISEILEHAIPEAVEAFVDESSKAFHDKNMMNTVKNGWRVRMGLKQQPPGALVEEAEGIQIGADEPLPEEKNKKRGAK
jgi:predicted transcriptional regulator